MLSLFQSFIPSICTTFNELSKPSAKHITDKEEFERDHNRNKTVLLVHGSAFFQFLLNLIFGNGDLPATLQGLIGTSCVIIVLCLSARFNIHPQIFKSVYNVYVVSFGMMFIQSSENGIIGACMAAPLFPIIVYFLTGSIAHFWFHTFCQIMLINTFYQGLIKDSLQSLSLDRAPMDFTYFANQSMVYSLISTAFMHYTMKNAFIKAKIAEMKKEEFQKQKDFLLGFSHELRNLINSLMGNVKLCLLQNPSEKIKDLLTNAEVCGELLLHSVNNILDTGKAEIGDLEINPVPTRIYDTLERIWSVCSELIKRKNLRGRIKIQKDIPQIVEIDHYRITQIFLNLVGNAVKYTDSGTIDITVEWLADQDMREKCFEPYPFNEANDQDEGIFEKSQTMSIFNPKFIFLSFLKRKIDRNLLRSSSDKKGVLKISVTDTGCGIVKEDLGKLFQMFTQGSIDPSKKKLGTGLGLFITKELCQRMGGDVKVFSKRGMGSAFTFCIPIQPIATERAFFFNLEGIHNAIIRQRLRAMIVDDEQFSQHILRDFLTKLNVDVVDIAENGLIAYKRFEDRQRRKDYVNIVTMDLQMPVMDGKIAAQKIREIESNHNLEPSLMIIVSANCSESEIAECLDKNGRIKADAFVKKPVSIDELCRIISSHFALSYDRQRVRLLND